MITSLQRNRLSQRIHCHRGQPLKLQRILPIFVKTRQVRIDRKYPPHMQVDIHFQHDRSFRR
ncbi:hypothetical protein J2Z31_003427 [Sinorhizobium kostiense]|uniref:Uncharacterized protein n=1 Tax=Sinorhizobium kostiense TaxID=76747 RepID=A0ABS4R1Y2_9HYPH|nr:hypothetical protein [Sinorhizobium kostiense]